FDTNGHGTHCAGIIGAVGNNGTGITGVCWEVRLMALKALNQKGLGYVSDVIECIQYALSNGAQIINCGWGTYNYSSALKEAIEIVKEKNILFITASGNDGLNIDNNPFYPASYDCGNIISVAAISKSNNLAIFSNYGSYSVDVVFPGESIFSTLPNNSYGNLSGTSMASSFGCGVVSLVIANDSIQNYLKIKSNLLNKYDSKIYTDRIFSYKGSSNIFYSHKGVRKKSNTSISTNVELIDSLNKLKEQILDKIEFDVDVVASSFASTKDKQRSLKWADIFGAILTYIKNTLNRISSFYDLADIRNMSDMKLLSEKLKKEILLVKTPLEAISILLSVDSSVESGHKLQLAFDGPSYCLSIEKMLDKAQEESGSWLNFNMNTYKTSVKYFLYGWEYTPIVVPHRSSNKPRKNVETAYGAKEVKRAIKARFNDLVDNLSKFYFPSNLKIEMINMIEKIREDIRDSKSNSIETSYYTFLKENSKFKQERIIKNLGNIAAKQKEYRKCLDDFDRQMKREIELTINSAIDTALAATKVICRVQYPKFYSSEWGKLLSEVKKVFLLYPSINFAEKITKFGIHSTNPREEINMLPQEMTFTLIEELRDLWTIAYDIANCIEYYLPGNPKVNMKPLGGTVGTTFTNSGIGFTSNSTVTLWGRRPDQSEWKITTVSTNESGEFSLLWTAQTPGTFAWWAIDDNTGSKSNEINYKITDNANYPHIDSINPSRIIGSTFNLEISGYNFDDGSVDQIFWKQDNHYVGKGTIVSHTDSHIISEQHMSGAESGTYVVRVKNSDGRYSNGVELVIDATPEPDVVVNPASGPEGTEFNFNSNNFTAYGTATLFIDNIDATRMAEFQIYIDKDGKFVLLINSNNFGTGRYSVWAKDNSRNKLSNKVTFEITCSKPETPNDPKPFNGASGVPINSILEWEDAEDANSFDVYFGTSSPPENKYSVASNSFNPGILEYGKDYYWQVIAKNNCGESVGPEWHFYSELDPSVQPNIRSTIDPIDFGEIHKGNKINKKTTIYNIGEGTLKISNVNRKSGSSDFNYYGPELPFFIYAKSSKEIKIQYFPSSTGEKSAFFKVNSNDPDEPELTFNVSGKGVFPGHLTVTPRDNFVASGLNGGPFNPQRKTYNLENDGGETFNWTASTTRNWVDISKTSGSLSPGESTEVEISLNNSANSLIPGEHKSTISFNNTISGGSITREVFVTVAAITQYNLKIYPTTGGTTDPNAWPEPIAYNANVEVDIKAIPDDEEGYKFSHWSGDASGTDSEITITMDSDKFLTANFVKGEDIERVGYYINPSNNYARGIDIVGNYAYIAYGKNGLQIVDISDSENPSPVKTIDTPGDAKSVFVSDSYAYVADDTGGLRIVDISVPSNEEEVGKLIIQGNSAQDVFVIDSMAYVAAGFGGLRLIDVSDPINPTDTNLGFFETPNAYGIAVSDTTAYLADLNTGLRIIDISNPSALIELGTFNMPEGGAWDVFVSEPYAYMCESSNVMNGLRIIDVSNPSNPTQIGYLEMKGTARRVFVAGLYAYVAGGGKGLRIIDISEPTDPNEVAFYDTSGFTFDIKVTNPLIYVADGLNGLVILKYTGCQKPGIPTNPTPSDNTLNQPLNISLKWDDLTYATSYQIYFGLTQTPRYHGEAVANSYDIHSLKQNTTYYWKVLALNECGTTEGPIWSFRTGCPQPSQPNSPSPTNHAAGVTINTKISWGCEDADSYDIYFGPSYPPLKVGNTQNISYDPSSLEYDTEYFWKVVAKNSCGEKEGPEWNFHTETRPSVVTISGCVKTSNGEAISGTMLNLSNGGGTATSFSDGDYFHAVDYGWTGTVIPVKEHYIFDPTERSYSNITSDMLNQDYIATRIIYSPLNFSGKRVLNRSLSQAEYINVLSWNPNQDNVNITKYRIYLIDEEMRATREDKRQLIRPKVTTFVELKIKGQRNRIYQTIKKRRNLTKRVSKIFLVELDANIFEYWHRKVDKNKQYIYALCAVNDKNREGEFAYLEIR
ncbi:MAG: S8 family serine peptidase, partial [Methanosarcinales archaeon]